MVQYQLLVQITKVAQNNIGMHTKQISQQTFKTLNNNLDGRFERVYRNHNNEILQTRKQEEDVPHFMMVKS